MFKNTAHIQYLTISDIISHSETAFSFTYDAILCTATVIVPCVLTKMFLQWQNYNYFLIIKQDSTTIISRDFFSSCILLVFELYSYPQSDSRHTVGESVGSLVREAACLASTDTTPPCSSESEPRPRDVGM